MSEIRVAVKIDDDPPVKGGMVMGAANGVPGPLDGSGKLPAGQVPATDGSDPTALHSASNLSDVASASAARTNLGLGTAATHPAGDFATPADIAALGSVYVPVVKYDNGGAFPKPLRALSLSIMRTLPNPRTNERVLWGDRLAVYTLGTDAYLRKYVDGVVTGVDKGSYAGKNLGYRDTFLKLSNGNLVALMNDQDPMGLARSTDDGATFTVTQRINATAQPLGSQSICEDLAHPGTVYFGEYVGVIAVWSIWKSTDYGATWTAWKSLPGLGDPTNPDRIRHCHSISYDPFGGRVWFFTGDSEPKCGMYRTLADGSDWEPIATREMAGVGEQGRAIGPMWFPDYLVWGSDSTQGPSYIYRLARTQFGQPSPVIETLYRVNGPTWWSVLAASDYSAYIVSSTSEGSYAIDTGTHVYAVTDQGASILEIGTLGVDDPGNGIYGAICPAGPGGDVMWINSRRLPGEFSVQAQLVRGWGNTPIHLPTRQQLISKRKARNISRVNLQAGESIVIGSSQAPTQMTTFYLIDAGVSKISGSGTLKIKATRRSDGLSVAALDHSASQMLSSNYATPYYASTALTAGDVVDFTLYESSGSAAVMGSAFIEFGWANTAPYRVGWDGVLS